MNRLHAHGDDTVALRINGSLLAIGRRPELNELDVVLRGIALSDSPVLIRAGRADDRARLADRIHALGRRSGLPVHECRSVADADELFHAVEGKSPEVNARGTWTLHSVATWPKQRQLALGRLLAALDESRLHGRLAHESIPRVVVLESTDATQKLEPELERRLSFFNIAAAPATEREARR